MTSCQSVKVVYKYIVPDYDYPIFPALDREIHKDGSWTIPKEDVDALAEFYLNYSKLEATYKHDKELYSRVDEGH